MFVRNAKPSDIDSTISLLKECRIFYEPVDKKDAITRKLEHGNDSILVAENNSGIVGCVFVIFDPWQSFIYHLCVRESGRGSKTGSKFMQKAGELIKNRGCELSNVFIDNESTVDFYKKRDWYVLYKVINMEKGL